MKRYRRSLPPARETDKIATSRNVLRWLATLAARPSAMIRSDFINEIARETSCYLEVGAAPTAGAASFFPVRV